ncbi:hypothetical protein [Rhodospirillaceae bacterium SYSU D60014]|uniref:hypothetical protein n=1 Tax=Virgifigura deserti TaxID=2268457 RepID=UPI000E668E97
MMSFPGTSFPSLPPGGGDPRQVATVVNRMNQGKLNCTGELTLSAAQSSTTVSDPRAGVGSTILLIPLTPSAAAEQAAGGLYLSARANGSFVVGHADTAQADRRFGYAIIG